MKDKPRFKVWAQALEPGRDLNAQSPQQARQARDQRAHAIAALRQYIAALIEHHRQQPGPEHSPDFILTRIVIKANFFVRRWWSRSELGSPTRMVTALARLRNAAEISAL
jgi:hypothetical protein